ncbi:MAG TPA: S8 family serine peptidase [Acidimicrobiales bacterium]|nr:S8 family serine peptidase [Acidimicrobiales bacterium]
MSASNRMQQGRAKLQPKLQMIANGSSEVNAVRAERCAGLGVTSQKLLQGTARRRKDGDMAVAARARGKLPARQSLDAIPEDVEAAVFVHLNDAVAEPEQLPGERARRGNLVSAQVKLASLPDVALDGRVAYVEIGEALQRPTPTVMAETVPAPTLAERRFGTPAQHRYGEDVLVGFVDVGGFDFSHPDFLDPEGKTRFVAIWDQGGDARPSPGEPGSQFGYGAEFTKVELDAALEAEPVLGVPAYEIEPQSQLEEGSHGTHVASTAAGNRGVCRRSAIAGVLLSLPQADTDRRRSFYDSTRLADAVDYLVDLAGRLGKRLSVNISLGTNGHGHDGAGAIGRWLDATLATPGRAITVAAGNAGQERGETPDDIGFVMGRVHTGGVVAAADLTADIDWVVVGNGIVDISENELELWFSPQDRLDVSLRTPQGEWIGPIRPREFIENRRLADGSFVSIYNELYHPANGANYMGLYLSPNMDAQPVIGVPAGTWTVRIRGREIRDGRYDGWIERDDPAPVGILGPRRTWAFPSFFTERSTVDTSTVSSLGCGQSVVTVANLDTKKNAINISSSQGPTRDGRFKPDVAAPGTDIVAAKGFSTDGARWIGMTGTSMASPLVAGVAGLMLAIEPELTAAQIEGIIRSTARPLPGGRFAWVDDAGFGVIDPERCLEQAARANQRVDRTKR